MALDEKTRLGLYRRLGEVLGPEWADAMMSGVPPAGDALALRSDVLALRVDMDALRQELRQEIQITKHELIGAFRGGLNAAITAQTRTIVLSMLGAVVSMGAMSLGVATLG